MQRLWIVMLHNCKCGNSHIINVFDNEAAANACMKHENEIDPGRYNIHQHFLRSEWNVGDTLNVQENIK